MKQSPELQKAVLSVHVFAKMTVKSDVPRGDAALIEAAAWAIERQAVQKIATDNIEKDTRNLHPGITIAEAAKIAQRDTSVAGHAPICIFLRGNSGAGKFSMVRPALPVHLAALDILPSGPHADYAMGALHPDDASYALKEKTKMPTSIPCHYNTLIEDLSVPIAS